MIFVDDREHTKLLDFLKNSELEVEIKRLDVGDYLIAHESMAVIVERKAINDFESSLISGRLFDQVYKLSRNYKHAFLCIIGDELNRLSKNAFIGSIVNIALSGVKPIILKDEKEFCLFLKYLDKQIRNNKLKAYPRIIKNSKVEDNVAMLTAIPGIGVEKAKKLLEKFGSIYGVANASISELMRVEGIGEKQAKRIYYFIRGKKLPK